MRWDTLLVEQAIEGLAVIRGVQATSLPSGTQAVSSDSHATQDGEVAHMLLGRLLSRLVAAEAPTLAPALVVWALA